MSVCKRDSQHIGGAGVFGVQLMQVRETACLGSLLQVLATLFITGVVCDLTLSTGRRDRGSDLGVDHALANAGRNTAHCPGNRDR